jgi:hypothetical protein
MARIKMDKDKSLELKTEYDLICDALNKLSKDSRYTILYDVNLKRKWSTKCLVVDCQMGRGEKSITFYGALLHSILKKTHFESSKCYKHKEGFGRYYIAPNWKYFFGDEYNGKSKDDYVVPSPKEVAKISKSKKEFLKWAEQIYERRLE